MYGVGLWSMIIPRTVMFALFITLNPARKYATPTRPRAVELAVAVRPAPFEGSNQNVVPPADVGAAAITMFAAFITTKSLLQVMSPAGNV
jgi:hypothetical protein